MPIPLLNTFNKAMAHLIVSLVSSSQPPNMPAVTIDLWSPFHNWHPKALYSNFLMKTAHPPLLSTPLGQPSTSPSSFMLTIPWTTPLQIPSQSPWGSSITLTKSMFLSYQVLVSMYVYNYVSLLAVR